METEFCGKSGVKSIWAYSNAKIVKSSILDHIYMGKKQEDAYLPNIMVISRVTQTLIVNLILKRFLRNLRDISKCSSQSVKEMVGSCHFGQW